MRPIITQQLSIQLTPHLTIYLMLFILYCMTSAAASLLLLTHPLLWNSSNVCQATKAEVTVLGTTVQRYILPRNILIHIKTPSNALLLLAKRKRKKRGRYNQKNTYQFPCFHPTNHTTSNLSPIFLPDTYSIMERVCPVEDNLPLVPMAIDHTIALLPFCHRK